MMIFGDIPPIFKIAFVKIIEIIAYLTETVKKNKA